VQFEIHDNLCKCACDTEETVWIMRDILRAHRFFHKYSYSVCLSDILDMLCSQVTSIVFQITPVIISIQKNPVWPLILSADLIIFSV